MPTMAPTTSPPTLPGDPRNLCAQRFRSFEWNTGLYTAYSGEKRVCLYLTLARASRCVR